MKKLFFIHIFIFGLAQNLFAGQISGYFVKDSFWSDTLYLDKLKSLEDLLSTAYQKSYFAVMDAKGSFNFQIDDKEKGLFRLRLKPKDYHGSVIIFNVNGFKNNVYPIVIENNNTNIKIKADMKNFFSTISITGDKLNESILSSLQLVRDRITVEEDMGHKIIDAKKLDAKAQDSLVLSLKMMYLKRLNDDFQKIKQYSSENPNQYISACILLQYNAFEMFLDSESNFLNDFVYFLSSCESVICQSFIERYQKLLSKNSSNKSFIPLAAYLPNGDSIQIKIEDKRYILLDFWASWCKPCRLQNRTSLQEINKKYGNQIRIVSVSVEDDKDLWLKAKKEDGISWDSYYIPKKNSKGLKDYYMFESYPTYHLFDSDGKAIKWFLMPMDLPKITNYIH